MYLRLFGATYGWHFNFWLNTHFYVRGAYENILIVEDSATYRELLCKVLKGKGYKVKIQVWHYFNMNSQKIYPSV